ncbi:MAG: hypothetical protein ACI4TH_01910 [Candidatus Ornithomonoglobus sp.]
MRYLRTFYINKKINGKEITLLEFAPVTIFCGSGNSGKTTLLNIIYQQLSAEHTQSSFAVFETDDNGNSVIPGEILFESSSDLLNTFDDYYYDDNDGFSTSDRIIQSRSDFLDYSLCFLDMPELGLSIDKELELVKYIEECAYLYGVQFIIATTSPIIASINESLIYDMDLNPVKNVKWQDTDIVKQYISFFKRK